MTRREKEHEFNTEFDSLDRAAVVNSGDVLVYEGEGELQLSELEITAEEPNVFDVDVRNSDSSNPRTIKTLRVDTTSGTDATIQRGNFEDPVAEAGSDDEIALRVRSSSTSGLQYTVNTRVDRRKT